MVQHHPSAAISHPSFISAFVARVRQSLASRSAAPAASDADGGFISDSTEREHVARATGSGSTWYNLRADGNRFV